MLHSLTANVATFKAFEFQKGLNIIVAERTQVAPTPEEVESQQRRTRNGAGKSSVIDIVHFVLGGRPEGALKARALAEWTFTLLLDLKDDRVLVERSIANSKLLRLPQVKEELSIGAWTQVLGEIWFGLSADRKAGGASFRQLFSYFARRRRDGGYDNPVLTFRSQSAASIETNLAVLFNLDAEIVRKLHQSKASLKQVEGARKTLRDLEKAAKLGDPKIELDAELSAQKAAAELSRDRLRRRVDEFNVLPAFRELEQELASLNEETRDLSDRDVLDQELIGASQRSLTLENPPAIPQLESLFREAGVVLPETVIRRYEEVFDFHRRLVENRREHLASEIASATKRISFRQARRESIETRRRQIVASLRGGRPAEELLRLRDELSIIESGVRALQSKLEEARKLDRRADAIQLDIDELVRSLRQDRRERSAIVDEASRAFSEISERLYESPGRLAISAADVGLRFVPSAPADQSAGVMSMEIFCFDMTISLLCHRRGLGPGFLIHDSHLFEPVDGRQFARALRIGAEIALENGFQYLVTLNSDELERAEKEGNENFSEYVIEPRLADTPDGGLFGIRFD